MNQSGKNIIRCVNTCSYQDPSTPPLEKSMQRKKKRARGPALPALFVASASAYRSATIFGCSELPGACCARCRCSSCVSRESPLSATPQHGYRQISHSCRGSWCSVALFFRLAMMGLFLKRIIGNHVGSKVPDNYSEYLVCL